MTYVTYASYYLARLNFSIALPLMGEDLQFSKLALGLIGGAFSISYAIGQFINGQLIDSLGAKKIAVIGLILSAAMNLLFGYADLFILFVIIWCINGYAQSTGWPSVVKIISNWFKSGLGTVGGAFGSCFLVGNTIAWLLLGYITANFGWRNAFLAPSILLMSMAVLFYLGIEEKPKESKHDKKAGKTEAVKSRFKRILFSKEIVTISLAYMLLQFVRSGLTLWAPSYLFETYGLPLDVTGYMATAIPIGGIAGSIISGWLSDRAKNFRRTSIIFILILFLSLTLLTFYHAASYGFQVGIALLFLSGLVFYGPHTLIVTVIPMEHRDTYGAASVAGFIDGIGYIGSTFADPLIGWIVDIQGWSGAVTFWLLSSLIAALLIGSVSWSGRRKLRTICSSNR